jgi:DNA-binding transcriptional regulator YdaS (Cro superfamily)
MSNQSPLRRYRENSQRTLESLGGEFGINKSTMMRWEEGRVPAERVLEVERFTGISRHELRPDIYGPAEGKAA